MFVARVDGATAPDMLRPSRVDLPPATAAACREVYDAAQCGDVARLRGLLHVLASPRWWPPAPT